MTALSLLTLFAPSLASDPSVSLWLEDARGRLSACGWGGNLERAVALLAAHNMTLSRLRPGGDAGAIASKREGDLAVSFSVSDNGSDWAQTWYGRQLADLQRSTIPAYSVTGPFGGCGV